MDDVADTGQHYDEWDVRLAETKQRLTGLEASFQSFANSISSQLSSLNTKLDERSRTPWATIFTAMGVVLGIVIAGGQLAKAPIDQAIARLEIDDASQVSMDQFKDFRTIYENNRIASRNDYDARFLQIANALNNLTDKVVPRGENEEHWRGNDREIGNLQRQIDDTKKMFGDTFSLRDALLQMQERLNKLETMREMNSKSP